MSQKFLSSVALTGISNGSILKVNSSGEIVAAVAGTDYVSSATASQWTTSGNDIYYSTGNVGIGESSPDGILHLKGSSQATEFYIESSTGTASTSGAIKIAQNNRSTESLAGEMVFYVQDNNVGGTYWREAMAIINNGNVGIGNSSPGNNRLKVTGATDITGTLTLSGYTAGLLKTNSSGTVSLDTNTYLTTSTASTTYLPLTGGTVANGNNASPLTIGRTSASALQVGVKFSADDGESVPSEVYFGMGTDGNPYWASTANLTAGSEIWHAGNDGASSGLDADLLDGNHASAFASSATFQTFGTSNRGWLMPDYGGNTSNFLRMYYDDGSNELRLYSYHGTSSGAANLALYNGSSYATVTATKIGNWDTAYGWGNHASAGYITSLSGYATTTYVDTAVSNLVDSAPTALNTLNELAAALGDDASFSTTVSTALGNRLRLDSAVVYTTDEKATGRSNLGLGSAATSATTDFAAASHNHDSTYLALSGGTVSGDLVVNGEFKITDAVDVSQWGRSYSVSNTVIEELLLNNGNSFESGGAYRVVGHIDGTGTDQSSTAVFWNQNGTWNVNVTGQSGTSSNHIQFLVYGGVPCVKTYHSNNYTVRVYHERIGLSEGTGTDNARYYFGADSYMSDIAGTLKFQGSHTIWHSGNDGASSGLDADTLDGSHASAFAAASHNHDGRYYTETEVDTLLAGKASTETATTSKNGLMSSTDKTKLDGIASGAEVNVQADWNQTTTTADDYIKNKPTLGTAASSASTDFVAVSGDTMSGDLNMNGNDIWNIRSLTLSNLEKSNIAYAYQILADANDSDAPATLGTYTSSYPEGLYFRDNSNTHTYTLYHTGHFSGTHIANWQTAYGWGDHAGLYATASHTHTNANSTTDGFLSSGDYDKFVTAFGWGDHDGLYLPIGGGTMSGTMKVTGSIIHEFNSGGGYIPFPKGGYYVTTTGSHTGAIKITLPVHGTDDMLKFVVDIFDYSTGESVTMNIAGYLYQTTGNNEWTNCTVTTLTERTDRDYAVRFGGDGTNNCLWIGETNSTWSYPQVIVRDFYGGYSMDVDAYDDNWSISFVTSFDTVDETITDNLPTADWDRIEGKPGNATTSVDGLMSSTDKSKLDGIDSGANNYSLPLGTSTTRGGFKVGYTETGKNYPVELSSEKMYVNVPWTDTDTTYEVADETADGLMSAADFTKLQGVEENANNYVLPTNIITAGTYGSTSNSTKIDTITVDSSGRVTAVATGGTGDITGVNVTGPISGGGTSGTVTIGLTTPTSGDWWNGGAVVVGTDGVMEIGKYIDFHDSDTETSDFSYRMTATNTNMAFSGTITATGYNDSNWNTAYSWGDHDGLYAAASHTHSYLPLSGGTVTGVLTLTGSSGVSRLRIEGTTPTIDLDDSDGDSFYIHVNSNNFYVLADRDGAGNYGNWESPHPLQLEADTNKAFIFGSEVKSAAFTLSTDYATASHTHTNADSSNDGFLSSGDYDKFTTAFGWGDHAAAGYASSTHNHNGTYAYYDHIRSLGSYYINDQGGNATCTTAQFITEIENGGAFDSYTSVFKTPWDYAGNNNISDGGTHGPVELAGMSFITWTDNSSDTTRGNITVLGIAPNTGGSAGGVYVWNDQGSNYSPGWREIWTSATDGSGSGLDADLLDGNHASAFALSSHSHTNADSSNDGFLSSGDYDKFTTAFGWGDHDGLYLPIGGGTVTGSTTIEGDLTVGKDGTTPQLKLVYDDNHANGSGWNTLIELGSLADRLRSGNNFPTYLNQTGYGLAFQANSDGVVFGMEEYSAGNFRPVIAWGDDASDTPFNFRHNGSVIASLGYNGNFNAVGTISQNGVALGSAAFANTTDFATSGLATASEDGLMSSTDKSKLDGIAANANNYSLPSDISVSSVTIGSGVTLSESTDRADLLSINSGTSGWGGLQVTNTAGEGILSLMINGSNGGLYDDQNSDWILYYTENGGVQLRHNSTSKIETLSTGVVVSGEIRINDSSTVIKEGANNSVNISTGTGSVDIGSMNTSWVHIQADRDIYILPGTGGKVAVDGNLTPYSDNAKTLGASGARWSTIYGVTGTFSGDVVAYSDARVKENVETIETPLDKVMKLRGVSFNRTGEDRKNIGVIAQEIREVLPEVVHEQEDGMLAVAYGNIVGLLIEAMKEQQEQIDELKSMLGK